jgi:hypothetical protein
MRRAFVVELCADWPIKNIVYWPFDVFLEPARQGGPSAARKVVRENEILALKTFNTDVNEESLRKELSVLTDLNHVHVHSVTASLKGSTEKFHILPKPWCEVWTHDKVVSDFSVVAWRVLIY